MPTAPLEAPPAWLPTEPGAYVLEYHVRPPGLRVTVGRLGTVWLPAGRLHYHGSAWGPGGLRGRVWRHLRAHRARRPHWHVDALTAVLPVVRVGLCPHGRECEGVARERALGWSVPVPRLGATDCRRCPAHLLAQPRP